MAAPAERYHFSSTEKFVVAVLAFLQFTIILDFMILSPLGAVLMKELQVSPSQFGLVVSVYAFAAGSSGLLAAGFADRFDRKKMLLFFYSGFVLGTFLCAIANSYYFLLFARLITGFFGGVIGSIVLSITTDLFPYRARGQVMGIIQTAFAASQVLGIPAGLYLANLGGWHMPFFLIVISAILVGIVIWLRLPAITGHLSKNKNENPFHHLKVTVSTARYLRAFGTVALLSTGGFMLMPFGSAFAVHNLGIALEELPFIYVVTGLVSIVTGPIVGKLADRYGKFKMFTIGTSISIVMVAIYTHLGITPIYGVMLVNSIMFMGIFSRMIPSQAMISAIPEPENRGSFMAISSSTQQISGGIASVLAGLIVVEGTDGKLENFPLLGYVVIGASLLTLFLMFKIRKEIPERGLNATTTAIAET